MGLGGEWSFSILTVSFFYFFIFYLEKNGPPRQRWSPDSIL